MSTGRHEHPGRTVHGGGALGFAIQIVALALLTGAGWPLVAATAIAVEIAILHNFCWHECWTWRDRASDVTWAGRLVRFHAATGVASIGANVILTTTLVEACRLQPVSPIRWPSRS